MERSDPSGQLGVVLSKLKGVRRQSRGFVATCPAHEDSTPSLSVAEGRLGVLLHCWAGCTAEQIVEASAIEWDDLFFDPRKKREIAAGNGQVKAPPVDRRGMAIEADIAAQRLQAEPEVLARLRHARGWAAPALKQLGVGWDGERLTLLAHDSDGKEHDVLRYDPFAPARQKMLAGRGRSRHPWPAPERVQQTPGWPLVIVEGEGTAISVASLGIACVALPGAVSRPTGNMDRPGSFRGPGWHPSWVKRFAQFRRILLLPDCDESGRTLMTTVRYDLQRANHLVIHLDLELDAGQDIGDVLRVARNGHDRAMAKQLLRVCVDTEDRQPHNTAAAAAMLTAWARTRGHG